MTVKQKIMRLACSGVLLVMPMAAIYGGPVVMDPLDRGQATVTRDVAEYTNREQALMATALGGGDSTALPLADDFEAWSTANDWQSKAEWLASAQQIKSYLIKDVSVRVLDGLVVVQFLLRTQSRKGNLPQNKIVVDIWRQSSQQLAVRYTTDTSVSQRTAALSQKR